MNKSELIRAVAAKADLTVADATRAVDAAIEVIGSQLAEGEEVSIHAFGIFTTKQRAARIGRHPGTGEEMQIKASVAPAFKPGKALKDRVQH